MRNIFSMDSKFMQMLNLVADYVLFNLLFLVTALLPVVVLFLLLFLGVNVPQFAYLPCLAVSVVLVGPAKTALYRVMFDMTEDRGNPYKRYFKTYFGELRTVVPLCLLKDGVTLFLFWEFTVVLGANQMPLQKVVLVALGAIGLLWAVVFSTLFPQVAVFPSTRKEYLHDCLYITLSRFLRCLLTALMDVLPLALFLLNMNLFSLLLPVFGFFYFTVTTNLCVRLWQKPFDKYIESAEA